MAEVAFIDKVAERAGVPEETARLLTEGTLLTLAARISGGEAEDLAERVPDQIRSYLIKLSEKEFTDAMAQLPKEFDQLMATASTAR